MLSEHLNFAVELVHGGYLALFGVLGGGEPFYTFEGASREVSLGLLLDHNNTFDESDNCADGARGGLPREHANAV